MAEKKAAPEAAPKTFAIVRLKNKTGISFDQSISPAGEINVEGRRYLLLPASEDVFDDALKELFKVISAAVGFQIPPCQITSPDGRTARIFLDSNDDLCVSQEEETAPTRTRVEKMANDEIAHTSMRAAFLLLDKLDREKPSADVPLEDIEDDIAELASSTRQFLKARGFHPSR
jgi:hypothetical protein